MGINAGYAPRYGQKECFALAELAKEYDAATYSHVRYIDEQQPNESFDSIKDLISNATLSGAHM